MHVTSVEIIFRDESYPTSFQMWTKTDTNEMYFRMTDGNLEDGNFVQGELSLDELEYLAHRILNAVEFQRKQISVEYE